MVGSRIQFAFYAALFGFALVAGGCKGTGVTANVNASVRPQIPGPGNSGPVMPMSVECDGCGGPVIAIIDIDGLLVNAPVVGPGAAGENPVSLLRERLDAAAGDCCVRGVVLRINTPGGGVTATDIMWQEVRRFKNRSNVPVVACLMDMAAGGGYYIATAADQIVAHPTSVVGGVGVILNVYNLEDALAQFNIVATPVKSGNNIDIGSPIKALTAEQKALLQNMTNEFHARFKNVVTEARPNLDAANEELFDGRVFTASQAEQHGLIDGIGYLDDAVEHCRSMANCPAAAMIMYRRCPDQPHTPYAVVPYVPLQTSVLPISLPGLDRTKLPTFMYLWQMEPSAERMSGR